MPSSAAAAGMQMRILSIRHLEWRDVPKSPNSMCATRAAHKPPFMVFRWSLHAGDIGVLIGPSGCGKTTLLRRGGLEPVSSGEIRLTKSVVSSATLSVPPEQRRIGMVFQDYALFPHLSVGAMSPSASTSCRAPNKLPAWPRCCNWWAWKAARTATLHELSGGQQQRVALARALAPRARSSCCWTSLFQPRRGPARTAGARGARHPESRRGHRPVRDARPVRGLCHWRCDRRDARRPPAPVGRRVHLYHRPATRFVADFIGHGVLPPPRWCSAAQRGGPNPLGDLTGPGRCPLPSSYPGGECDVLLRPTTSCTTTTHRCRRRSCARRFAGQNFWHTLRLRGGLQVMAHVPSHHDHAVGEWIGIRAQVIPCGDLLHAAHEATGQFASNQPLAPAEKAAAAIFFIAI